MSKGLEEFINELDNATLEAIFSEGEVFRVRGFVDEHALLRTTTDDYFKQVGDDRVPNGVHMSNVLHEVTRCLVLRYQANHNPKG